MRYKTTALLAMLALGGLLMTALTGAIPRSTEHVFSGYIADTGITEPQYIAPGYTATVQAAGGPNRIVVPENRSFTITEFHVALLGENADANEHCEYLVEYRNDSTDTTGTELSGTSVHTGDHALNIAENDYCDEGINHQMSAQGARCSVSGLNQTVPGGGWFRVKIDASAADGQDARSCADADDIEVQILGWMH